MSTVSTNVDFKLLDNDSRKQNEQSRVGPTTTTTISSCSTVAAADKGTIVLSVEQAIDKLGYGKFQILVMIAAGLCMMSEPMEILILSFLAVVLKAQWDLTNEQTAYMTAIVFFGAFLGTLVLGYLGDKIGRRPIIILSASIVAIFGSATAFCNNLETLIIARSFVGFAVGSTTVPYDSLAEFLPSSTRGKQLLYIDFFWTAGILLVPLLAFLTLSNDFGSPGDESWRIFVILCAIPCAISAILGIFVVPESPPWLCTIGKQEEALNILRRAAKMNGKDPDTLFPPNMVLKGEEAEEEATVCDLFSSRWRWLTIKLWLVWLTDAILYFGLILVSTRIFTEETFIDGGGETYSFEYGAIFTTCSAEIVGLFLVILTVDSIGRVPCQVFSYSVGGIAILLMGWLEQQDGYYDDGKKSNARDVIIIIVAFIARMFILSGSCVTWVATAEIFSTEIRASGHAAANAVARVGAFFSPFLVEEIESLKLIASLMFAISIVATVVCSRLPETRGKEMGTVEDDDSVSQAASMKKIEMAVFA